MCIGSLEDAGGSSCQAVKWSKNGPKFSALPEFGPGLSRPEDLSVCAMRGQVAKLVILHVGPTENAGSSPVSTLKP